ncbi:hypothetical protein ACSBR1_016901 [Camellia fascicularis]
MPGYNNFTIQNDIDMENMVYLARSFWLDLIDVIIQSQRMQGAVDIGDATRSPRAATYNMPVLADDSDIDDDQQDLLPKNREHSCGVAVRTAKNPRVGSELVSDVISKWIRDRPLTHPIDVVYDLKKYYGLEISYRVTRLGIEKACGKIFGAHSISFNQLQWYNNAVMDNNRGSYINIDYNEQNHRFERIFISFKACIDGFNPCHPLLFLDGTFLKGKFKGNLLMASVKDGNQGWSFPLHTFVHRFIPLAIAIVDSENTVNWSWFLEHLANVVSNDRTLTVLSDRHIDLIDSIPKIFPIAHHAFCLQHLQRNLQDKMWGARYDEMCSNAAESFNS